MSDADSDLQPLEPREAMEMWLDRQKSRKADETVQSYRYRIAKFVRWCEQDGIENLNELDGRDIYRYETELEAQDLSRPTVNNQLGTLTLFLDSAENMDAVQPDLALKVNVPELRMGQRANETKLTAARAETIQENLARFEYASLDHVLFALAWETGCRLSALRALDVRDCYLTDDDIERLAHEEDLDEAGLYKASELEDADLSDKISVPFVFFRHRSETALKNQENGERPVSLSDDVGQVLSDYLDINRKEVVDENGREPVFATEKGERRMSKGAIRRRFNIVTQPCRYGGCPHDRDTTECEALDHGLEQRCPSARSPHPVRTGSITDHRDRGWAPADLSERVDATPETIAEHYDHPELLRRMESRRTTYLGDSDQ